MSDVMEQIVTESVRIVRAQERVGALLIPMEQMDEMIAGVLEIAPELAPELNEVRGRLSDSCGHLKAALEVIQAKIDLL